MKERPIKIREVQCTAPLLPATGRLSRCVWMATVYRQEPWPRWVYACLSAPAALRPLQPPPASCSDHTRRVLRVCLCVCVCVSSPLEIGVLRCSCVCAHIT
jgi:hypothetical protein